MTKLNTREQEVFDLLATGLSERDVADRLAVDDVEVDLLWRSIRVKLQTMEPDTPQEYEILLSYERIERRILEREVWAGEARLNALMDTAPEAVFLIAGQSGRILKANNNAVVMFGYSPRELIGMVMEELLPPSTRGIHVNYRTGFLNSVRKRQIGYHPPIFALRRDGSRIQLDIALTATQKTDDVMVVCRQVELFLSPEEQSEQPSVVRKPVARKTK